MSAEVQKSGWLVKRAMKSGRNWKKRYFVLTSDGTMKYYEKKGGKKPKGVIHLSGNCTVGPCTEEQYAFMVDGEKKLVAKCESEFEMNDWIKAVKISCGIAVEEDSPKRNSGKGFGFGVKRFSSDAYADEERTRGYLKKLGGGEGGTKNWNRRFFVLQRDLRYYATEEDFLRGAKPKGTIYLDAFYVHSVPGDEYEFTVYAYPKSLTCRASSAAEREAWMNFIRKPQGGDEDMLGELYQCGKVDF